MTVFSNFPPNGFGLQDFSENSRLKEPISPLIIFKSILVFLYLSGKATDGYQGQRLLQYSQIPRRIQTNEDGFSGIAALGWVEECPS
jgi:hypothetical protein